MVWPGPKRTLHPTLSEGDPGCHRWPGGHGHCVLCWLCYCLASYMTLEIFLNITFQFIKQFCTHYLPHLLLTETLPVGHTLSLTSLWQTLHSMANPAHLTQNTSRLSPRPYRILPPATSQTLPPPALPLLFLLLSPRPPDCSSNTSRRFWPYGLCIY